jgi:hypothetical protein
MVTRARDDTSKPNTHLTDYIVSLDIDELFPAAGDEPTTFREATHDPTTTCLFLFLFYKASTCVLNQLKDSRDLHGLVMQIHRMLTRRRVCSKLQNCKHQTYRPQIQIQI